MIQQILDGILMGGLYVVVALGLTSLFSVFRVINLAHGALIMVGAYITFFVTVGAGVNFFFGMLAAMAVTGALLLIVERVVFRQIEGRSMLIQMVATMAITMIVESGALLLFRTRARSISTGLPDAPLMFFGLDVGPQRLLLLGVALIVVFALRALYKHTKIGLATLAVAQNREVATALGVDPKAVSMFNFYLSGALAGIAGSLLGAATAVTPAMGVAPLIKGLIVIVLGGLGSVGGCIAGGFTLGVLDSLGAFIPHGISEAVPFIIFLIFLFVRPTGFFGKEI